MVVISEALFYRGSRALFATLNELQPSVARARAAMAENSETQLVELNDWVTVKDSVRNPVYDNFNPGLLPRDHELRKEIFENMASTAGLFMALEPKVLVSKIRCRVFRTWKAAEDYYSNTLLQAKFQFAGETQVFANVPPELLANEPAIQLELFNL